MWFSHLGGERSRKRVNSLRGVSSRCSSFSSFQITPPHTSASPPVPDSTPSTAPPPPRPALLPTHEQMAPELKRTTREQRSGHQLQIPQANMRVRRPSSSVTGSLFALPPEMSPVFPSSLILLGGGSPSCFDVPLFILFICLMVWVTNRGPKT